MLYRDYAPTPFDPRGLFLPDRQEWIVTPVIRTRDSGCLEESNFEAALKLLGGEGETVEVHRFGHWGPGWFEIILVAPGGPQAASAKRIERALESYPLLDEDDYSARQWAAACEWWRTMGTQERRRYLRRAGMDPRLANRVHFPSRHDVTGALFDLLTADA